jgi:hypothetical protein
MSDYEQWQKRYYEAGISGGAGAQQKVLEEYKSQKDIILGQTKALIDNTIHKANRPTN